MSNGAAINGAANGTASVPPKFLEKPGHYGCLSEEQSALFSQYEAKLTEVGALPDPLLADKKQRMIVLLRYLRARDWSVENATKMYTDSLQWRKKVDLEGMLKNREAGVDPFEERAKVAESGWKMYFHKTDLYNRPIFIQDLSYLNITEVFSHTTPDRIVQFFAIMLEGAIRHKYAACTEVTQRQVKEAGIVSDDELDKVLVDDNFMILNVAGLGMSTFWAFKNQLQQLLGILDTNYPELSGRIQIINAPWLFATIFSYIKGWLPKNTVGKIGIAGTDFHKELFDFIDPSALPVSMGGTCQCDHPGGCAFSDAGLWQKEAATARPSQAVNPTDAPLSE